MDHTKKFQQNKFVGVGDDTTSKHLKRSKGTSLNINNGSNRWLIVAPGLNSNGTSCDAPRVSTSPMVSRYGQIIQQNGMVDVVKDLPQLFKSSYGTVLLCAAMP